MDFIQKGVKAQNQRKPVNFVWPRPIRFGGAQETICTAMVGFMGLVCYGRFELGSEAQTGNEDVFEYKVFLHPAEVAVCCRCSTFVRCMTSYKPRVPLGCSFR